MTILSIDEVKTSDVAAPKLTHGEKADVVRRLACFEQPGAIAKSMKEDLGIEITRQSVAFYDPTRYSRRRCPKCWADLFWTTRAEFIAGKPDVGAAHGVVRVHWLDRMARDQMEKGDTAEARALLKQAADEMSRMAGHKDGNNETDRQLSKAEVLARLGALAAMFGHAIVPLGSHAAAGGDRAVDEPQPPGDPVSGDGPTST